MFPILLEMSFLYPCLHRPISILFVISKVFEITTNSSLTRHLETNNLLSDHQYGFCIGRSTADLLTAVTESIHQALDVSGEASAIALDISKTFNKVWHRGLIHKLQAYGISGKILSIIESFLSDRSILRCSFVVVPLKSIQSMLVYLKDLL